MQVLKGYPEVEVEMIKDAKAMLHNIKIRKASIAPEEDIESIGSNMNTGLKNDPAMITDEPLSRQDSNINTGLTNDPVMALDEPLPPPKQPLLRSAEESSCCPLFDPSHGVRA